MIQDSSKKGLGIFSTISILVVIAWGLYAVYDWWSPPIAPACAPADTFSAERAVKLLEYPTQMIHPYGSQELAKVRQYLVQKLKLLGVEPIVQTEYLANSSKHGHNSMERVDNIMVVLPGYAPTRSILVMGHYDSTPYGVGCADDGSAVAAMYETIQALLHTPPLKNDVIFLFTDGEEAGTLGPRAFMKHPLFETVGVCFNFEARGHYGPSMMYQTSNNNLWLIKEFAKAAPYPRASSAMFEIAGKMPTSTDFYVLKPKGVSGFDFAFVGGIRYYHTPNDDIEHLSLRSLQHHGSYALSLVKHFGNLDLSHLKIGYPFEPNAENSTYFTAPVNNMIVYSEKWIFPLLLLAIVLYLLMLLVMKIFWRIRVRDIVKNLIQNLVHILFVSGLIGGLIGLTFLIYKHYIVYYELTYLVMGLLTAAGLFLILLPIIYKRLDPHIFFSTALLPWLGLAIYTSISAPTASYIFVWIVIIGSICGMIGSVPFIPQRWHRNFFWFTFWTLIPTLVATYFFAPFLVLGVQTLTPIFIPVLMIFLILVLYLFTGFLYNLIGNKNICYQCGLFLLITGLLVYAYPMLFFRFTKETPKVNHLCYGLDLDTNSAWWMTQDKHLDKWLKQFFQNGIFSQKPHLFAGDNETVQFGEAPIAGFPEPLVSVLEDKTDGDVQHLKVSVISIRKAAEVRVELGDELEILSAKVNGIDYEGTDGNTIPRWHLRYRGFPVENGITFEWQLKHKQPLQITVVEKSYVLPPLPGIDMPPRPDYMIAEPNTVEWWKDFRSNAIYTRKTFHLN